MNNSQNYIYFFQIIKIIIILMEYNYLFPLHDTPTECGPTIIYKKNKIDYEHIKKIMIVE